MRCEQPARHQCHGPAVVAADVARCVDPLEISGATVDLDPGKTDRLIVNETPASAARDRREQGARRVAAQQRVDIAQVLAEQVVEQAVKGAGMVVAIPPEPVGALGDVDLVPGAGERGRIVPAGSLFLDQERASGVEGVPALVVLGMADPDGEVVADPAAGEEPGQACRPADARAGTRRP